MKVTVDGTVVRYTKDERTMALKHWTTQQAEVVAEAVRQCGRRPDMTLREFVDLWWRCYATWCLSENSRGSYRSVIDRHLLPFMADTAVRRLCKPGLLEYIDARAIDVGCYRKVTPWVIKLQAVLTKAVQWGLIDKNPVMEIDGLFLGGRPPGLPSPA
jgi:hypothetical protein